MDDLSMFADGSAGAVYASHVLEHGSYGQPRSMRWASHDCDSCSKMSDANNSTFSSLQEKPGYQNSLGLFAGSEVATTLAEWRRVLAPGGVLFVAVPDLPTLFRMYLEHDDMNARVAISRMVLGGQTDQHDIHLAGFDVKILSQVTFKEASMFSSSTFEFANLLLFLLCSFFFNSYDFVVMVNWSAFGLIRVLRVVTRTRPFRPFPR